jgi:predicted branched-subunit amino acid permease
VRRERSRGTGLSSYWAGARAVAPLVPESIVTGVAFGLLAQAAGMRLEAVVMSATTFAGAAQFAAISALAGGGGAVSVVAAAGLVNARYLAMGLAAAPAFHSRPLRRLLEAQLLVDESWAVAAAPGGFDAMRLVGAGAFMYVSWVGATAAGVVGATALPDPRVLGLDAAFPALFLSVLGPLLRTRQMRVVAGLAAFVALTLVPFVPPGLPVLAAGAVAFLAAVGGR